MNFSRDRKKSISIIISICIGGVLLLCASTLLLTYAPETLARRYFPYGDYKLFINSEKDISDIFYSGNPMTKELQQLILDIDGVDGIIISRQSAGADFYAGDYSGGGMADMITRDNYSAIEDAITEGSMPPDSHSILIADVYDEFNVGSSIQISLGRDAAEVTVSGKFDLTKITVGYGHQNIHLDGAMLYLPNELFDRLLPGVDNFNYSWDIISDPVKDAHVKLELQEIINSHTEIGMDFFSDQVEYSRSVYSVPFHILQGIALFISLFGIINLINTTLSNQISRRYEFCILRSTGLTKKQLYQMITFEGMSYILVSILVTIVMGLPLAYVMHRQISMAAYGFQTVFKFPFVYMMLYFFLLITIEFILSTWAIRRQEKLSLIEQLRALE